MPLIGERPIVGWGLNTYGWSMLGRRSEVGSDFAMHAHNEYVEMIVETGLVGGAICLTFVVLLLQSVWESYSKTKDPWVRGIRAGALASWVGILAYSFVDFPTVIPATNYVLAVLGGLGVAVSSSEPEASPSG